LKIKAEGKTTRCSIQGSSVWVILACGMKPGQRALVVPRFLDKRTV
jgi:hypothetical protein